MPKQVKATKERCLKCKYRMNFTGAVVVKQANSGALIACGYCLKSNDGCRTVKNGKKREDYKPGYCSHFEPGNRVCSRDSLLKSSTIKRRRTKE